MTEFAGPLDAARAYRAAGLSVIPVRADGSKAPAVLAWAEFMRRRATDEELERWFSSGRFGVAVVCGAVSGNLEVIDFDSAEAWEQWRRRVEADRPGLLDTLPRVATPSGGVHLYLRRDGKARSNGKLARDEAGRTLIELRGEGGYVLAPGSPAACHDSGRPYEWVTPLTW